MFANLLLRVKKRIFFQHWAPSVSSCFTDRQRRSVFSAIWCGLLGFYYRDYSVISISKRHPKERAGSCLWQAVQYLMTECGWGGRDSGFVAEKCFGVWGAWPSWNIHPSAAESVWDFPRRCELNICVTEEKDATLSFICQSKLLKQHTEKYEWKAAPLGRNSVGSERRLFPSDH